MAIVNVQKPGLMILLAQVILNKGISMKCMATAKMKLKRYEGVTYGANAIESRIKSRIYRGFAADFTGNS
jgi:hypothetical protein